MLSAEYDLGEVAMKVTITITRSRMERTLLNAQLFQNVSSSLGTEVIV